MSVISKNFISKSAFCIYSGDLTKVADTDRDIWKKQTENVTLLVEWDDKMNITQKMGFIINLKKK